MTEEEKAAYMSAIKDDPRFTRWLPNEAFIDELVTLGLVKKGRTEKGYLSPFRCDWTLEGAEWMKNWTNRWLMPEDDCATHDISDMDYRSVSSSPNRREWDEENEEAGSK